MSLDHPLNDDLYDRAQKVMPAGTFGNFDASVMLARGEGARVWDIDGREYVDYVIGSGPMLLGHGHPEVLEMVEAQLRKGLTFFTTNPDGVELAEEICAAVACAEQVRYFCTGSEADMYAVRLARAATGRSKILKFEGGYHGMSDVAQMSLAPATLANFPNPVPDSGGITEAAKDEVLVAPYNDLEFVRSLLAEHKHDIAAVLVEPLQRIIPPEPGFLEGLREITEAEDVLLIFDEVVTGFRLAYGGAQEHYGVVPDLCTMGKIIGGGFPLAMIAGRRDLMALFDKSQAGDKFLMNVGTLSGNPVAAVAGLKTMEILRRPGQYETLAANGRRIMAALEKHLNAAGHAHVISGEPCMFEVIFTKGPVRNYRDVVAGDADKLTRMLMALREHGILKPPGKWYISLGLTEADLQQTEDAIAEVAKIL